MKLLSIFVAFLGYGFLYWGIQMVQGHAQPMMYVLFKWG